MSKKERDLIIKYTLMPFNEEDDYERFFSLSLRELAKNTRDKTLLAPLILYNSELDVPMDNELEEYTIYCVRDQIIDVIRKQEINDVFRTLILHGFDISIDDLKEIYVGIARRNNADLCINIIEDTGIDSNITLYIDPCIEYSNELEWKIQKEEMEEEIQRFIETYDSDEYIFKDAKSYSEAESMEDFLMALFDCMDAPTKPRRKEVIEPITTYESNPVLALPEPEKKQDDAIAYGFSNKGDFVEIAYDDGLYVITENDFEVVLSAEQIDFIIDSYFKIYELLKNNEPRK